jgi:hypothetical protein
MRMLQVRKRKCVTLDRPNQEGLDEYRAKIDSFAPLQCEPSSEEPIKRKTLTLTDLFAGIDDES